MKPVVPRQILPIFILTKTGPKFFSPDQTLRGTLLVAKLKDISTSSPVLTA